MTTTPTPDDISDWLLYQALSAGDQVRTNRPTEIYPTCRWCPHYWHGRACPPSESVKCSCESSLGARDDAWRPAVADVTRMGRASKLMHDTGCDGYVAVAATRLRGVNDAQFGRVPPEHLMYFLLGGQSEKNKYHT